MVADIHTSGHSGPSDLGVFNGALYFEANDGANGDQLWKFDPTDTTDSADGTASMVTNTTGSGKDVDNLVVFNNALYFVADSDTYGDELWVYDGVNAPSIVKDLNEGSSNGVEDSSYGAARVYDGALYFEGNDGTGQELWKYDGTNFSRVTDIRDANADPDGNGNADIEYLTVLDGVLYFSADNGTDGDELWGYNADGRIV